MSGVSWKRFLLFLLLMVSAAAWAQGASPEKVIIDTDIGDDVDDAFALALAVKSPELQVLGVMTTFGDTEARAKIAERFLGELGREEILVLAGKATATKNPMSQRRYRENRLCGGGGDWSAGNGPHSEDFHFGRTRHGRAEAHGSSV